MTPLSNPAAIQERLEAIERDLAERQHDFEVAATEWFRAKRDREKERAEAFLSAEGTVAERTAIAESQVPARGEEEGRYEALKGVVRTLDTRAAIGMSILRAQSRGGV